MDLATYAVESQVEASHWWFVVRRSLFESIIKEMTLASSAKILDIGTSTGTNLRMLKKLKFINYSGLDLHEEAIRWCREKQLGTVHKGDICAIPFPDSSLDLILATDVIEHVDDDLLALQEISRVLAPGGRAIITVPAFQSLWGLQDDVSHHKRRYRMPALTKLLTAAELTISDAFYFNYLLFAPIWLARQIVRVTGLKLQSENQLNHPIINKLMTAIFKLDIASTKYIHPPFGVSILAVVSKI